MKNDMKKILLLTTVFLTLATGIQTQEQRAKTIGKEHPDYATSYSL
jgi:hypothetical protein